MSDLTALPPGFTLAGTEIVNVADVPLYSDNQLRAAVAKARADTLAAVMQLAREHGAVYLSEPRPCRHKGNCDIPIRERLPFADLIEKLGDNR